MNLAKTITAGFFLATLASCAITLNNSRFVPKYTGVDPKIAPYVNEWLSLAKERGLKFSYKVTVGFKNINRDRIVGVCHYGAGFREIDVDKEYWEKSNEIDKTVLIYHELVHCNCLRGHDYGDGKEYGNAEKSKKDPTKEDGFKNGCPVSLMFPNIVDNNCFLSYYQDYVSEMFDRCVER